jgi:hypothetical protein
MEQFTKCHKNTKYSFIQSVVHMGNLVYIFNPNRTFSVQFPYKPAQARIINHVDKIIKVRYQDGKEEVVKLDKVFKLEDISICNDYVLPEWMTIEMVHWMRAFIVTEYTINPNLGTLDYDHLFTELNLAHTVNTMKVKREQIIKTLKDLF